MEGRDENDPSQRAFFHDAADALLQTIAVSEMDPSEYDAVYFVGGHGAMWDFPRNAHVAALARTVYERGGVVAAVCHGVAALVDLKLSDGSFLVSARRATSFTDSEEVSEGFPDVVPFLLATAIKSCGATFVEAPDLVANVVMDGRLITGQNPASARGVAEQVLEALSDST